jgi:hypothetical protein
MEDVMIETNCRQCGKRFEAARVTARYCSSRCRSRQHRALSGKISPPLETDIATDALRNLCRAHPSDMIDAAPQIERMINAYADFMAIYLSIPC